MSVYVLTYTKAEVDALIAAGAGASSLDELSDVAITSAADGQALIRRSGTFVNDSIAQADVTGLVSDLAGKAATSHAHAGEDITSGTVANARTTAASANTASAIVARDASGDCAVSNITCGTNGGIIVGETAYGGGFYGAGYPSSSLFAIETGGGNAVIRKYHGLRVECSRTSNAIVMNGGFDPVDGSTLCGHYFAPSEASAEGIRLRGKTSQSADLFHVVNVGGTDLFRITSAGVAVAAAGTQFLNGSAAVVTSVGTDGVLVLGDDFAAAAADKAVATIGFGGADQKGLIMAPQGQCGFGIENGPAGANDYGSDFVVYGNNTGEVATVSQLVAQEVFRASHSGKLYTQGTEGQSGTVTLSDGTVLTFLNGLCTGITPP